MKIKEYKNVLRTKKLKAKLQKILKIHEDMRYCYFWTSPRSSERASYDKARSNELQFIVNGDKYEIDQWIYYVQFPEIENLKNNKKKAVILEVMENNSVYDYRIFIDGEGKVRKVKERNLFSE